MILFIVFLTSPFPLHADEAIAPRRHISFVSLQPDIPAWKENWDSARSLARDRRYQEAALKYEAVLKEKPNIQEAQWEYCKILVKLQAYHKVRELVATLLETDGNRIDYLLAGGQAALEENDLLLAERYYGKAFELEPTGQNAGIALHGLTEALKRSGKVEAAFSLLEQSWSREPDNLVLQHQLARDAFALDKLSKAKQLYLSICESKAVSDEILIEAITLLEKIGDDAPLAPLLADYVARHPAELAFREKYARILFRQRKYDEAAQQYAYLAANAKQNEDYLLKAGELSFRQLERPDKALQYYERYLATHPDDVKVGAIIGELQGILAKDFQSIAENDGARLLWQDLQKLTKNRKAIFMKMAELFEKGDKDPEAIKILQVVHQYEPNDEQIAWMLARKLFETQAYQGTLKILAAAPGDLRQGKAFYVLRGDCELRLMQEDQSLSSYQLALERDPTDAALAAKALSLAGGLGFIPDLEHLFAEYCQAAPDRDITVVASYLKGLAASALFQKYDVVFARAMEWFKENGAFRCRLQYDRIAVLRQQGREREAEQVLRTMFANGDDDAEVLFSLARDSFARERQKEASVWFGAIAAISEKPESGIVLNDSAGRSLLLAVEMLISKGQLAEAARMSNEYIDHLQTNSRQNKVSRELRILLEKQNISLAIRQGRDQYAVEHLRQVETEVGADPDLLVLRQELVSEKQQADNNKSSILGLIGKRDFSVGQLLDLAQNELTLARQSQASEILSSIDPVFYKSVRYRILLANLYFAQGKEAQALELLVQLTHEFPDEDYFYRKQIDHTLRQQHFADAISIFHQWFPEAKSLESLSSLLTSTGRHEELLILARAAWGEKKYDEALNIYKQLLEPPVLNLISSQFKEARITYIDFDKEKTIWNSLLVLLQLSPEILDKLMEPQFLVDNKGKPAGRIVAGNFCLYSWQKAVFSEYLSRKAIYEKNYYFAEQSYQQMIRNNNVTGLKDLAEIYNRLGKYRKEAQVYEEIASRGEALPDVENAREKNAIQLSPQNGAELFYNKSSGRDGQKDMVHTGFGSSFSFTPNLNSEATVSYLHNEYESSDTDHFLGSNTLSGAATYEFAKIYEFNAKFEAEKLNNESMYDAQYQFDLKGQLDEYFNAFVQFDRQLVDDTVASIEEKIFEQGFETGLNCETPSGISFGLDVRHKWYNGGNSGNQFHGYSAYTHFDDSLEMGLRYDYRYISGAGNTLLDDDPTSEFSRQSLYWLPATYTLHEVTVQFKQQLFGSIDGDRRKSSYYSVESGAGYEDNEDLVYSGAFNIFLEINPHFLLKGKLDFINSDDYDERGFVVSLNYRW